MAEWTYQLMDGNGEWFSDHLRYDSLDAVKKAVEFQWGNFYEPELAHVMRVVDKNHALVWTLRNGSWKDRGTWMSTDLQGKWVLGIGYSLLILIYWIDWWVRFG